MQVHTSLTQLPNFKNAVITIGTFDGIHIGHRVIIDQLINEAHKINGESIVITFDPHPRLITNPNAIDQLQLINTLEEKIKIFASLNINHLVIVPFTHEFAEQSAEQYIENFLVNNFKPHTIIIGYDHHFGKGRLGNFKLLETLQYKFNYQLIEIESAIINNIIISSTQIRQLISNGLVDKVIDLLAGRYTLSGKVVHGKKLGRTIGFPTANIAIDNPLKLIPANGIYAVLVHFDKKIYKGVLNIGTNPTTDNDAAIKIEVYILEFESEIYNAILTIEFIKKIRAELKFESIEELKKWIERDIALAHEIFDSI